MKLENVKITKIGNKDKPSTYLPLKRKLFISNGLSFDKTYDVELVFKEVEAKPEEHDVLPSNSIDCDNKKYELNKED